MGRLLFEDQKKKAPGNVSTREQDDQFVDSLEEKISVFYVQDIDEANRSYHGGDGGGGGGSGGGGGGDEYDSDNDDLAERITYWEAQEALLQEILERHSLTGQKLRQEVIRIVEQARKTDFCRCPKPSSDGCNHCLRRLVVNLLSDKGFNASLCTSKWKHTREFPGGSHEYIEIMATTAGRKKQLPFLVELEFRDQFEIAKACDEYRKLVAQLPEIYIGKPEYLTTIVRILCNAAKRSMKDKKIHMGPWRKRSFMEMKWSYSSEKRSLDHDPPSNKYSTLSSSTQARESCLRLPAAHAVVVT